MADRLSPALREEVDRHWQDYLEAAAQAKAPVPAHPDFLAVLRRVWAMSPFVARSCGRHPDLLADLLASGDLLTDTGAGEYPARLRDALATATDDRQLGAALRRIRRREMVRIAWRDLAGWAGLEQTLSDLTELADACIAAALARLDAWQCEEWSVPLDGSGTRQHLVVLGMGKLGAGELNFSSDVDLVFAYPGGRRNHGRPARATRNISPPGAAADPASSTSAPPKGSSSASTCACVPSATAARSS